MYFSVIQVFDVAKYKITDFPLSVNILNQHPWFQLLHVLIGLQRSSWLNYNSRLFFFSFQLWQLFVKWKRTLKSVLKPCTSNILKKMFRLGIMYNRNIWAWLEVVYVISIITHSVHLLCFQILHVTGPEDIKRSIFIYFPWYHRYISVTPYSQPHPQALLFIPKFRFFTWIYSSFCLKCSFPGLACTLNPNKSFQQELSLKILWLFFPFLL